jgi:hypothetical protein
VQLEQVHAVLQSERNLQRASEAFIGFELAQARFVAAFLFAREIAFLQFLQSFIDPIQ